MSQLEQTISQIELIRGYTLTLLEDLEPDEWFWAPEGGATHIAWQVGHIAIAQYSLALKRMRGARETDAELVPPQFGKLFGKGSKPKGFMETCGRSGEAVGRPPHNAGDYPEPAQIRAVLDRVHRQAITELKEQTFEALDVPTEPPHPMFTTKLLAAAFSPVHEMLYAGQIALLRRLLGRKPRR